MIQHPLTSQGFSDRLVLKRRHGSGAVPTRFDLDSFFLLLQVVTDEIIEWSRDTGKVVDVTDGLVPLLGNAPLPHLGSLLLWAAGRAAPRAPTTHTHSATNTLLDCSPITDRLGGTSKTNTLKKIRGRYGKNGFDWRERDFASLFIDCLEMRNVLIGAAARY